VSATDDGAFDAGVICGRFGCELQLFVVFGVAEHSWPEPVPTSLTGRLADLASGHGYEARFTPAYHGEADLVFVTVTRSG